jgi:hypothetical protein
VGRLRFRPLVGAGPLVAVCALLFRGPSARAQWAPLPERMAAASGAVPRELPPAEAVLAPADGLTAPPPWLNDGQPLAAPLEPWSWQLLPEVPIYRSYLAGVKEPRLGGIWATETDRGAFMDGTVGARVGILRLGTPGNLFPQGYQLDVEAAAFLRFDVDEDLDMDTADYRLGIPLTYGSGRFQAKFAFYHLSAHLADEFILKHPAATRINYSRDVLVLGGSYYPTDALRVYGEVGYATYTDGGTEPWELQLGLDYSTLWATGPLGAPFFAINGHLREEVNYGGEFVLQAGWQWRGVAGGRLLRIGGEYFNGQSGQYQFFRTSEEYIGLGIWYDF